MPLDDLFKDAPVIFEYTSSQAEDDGILFDVTKINPQWKKSLFNYVTVNLLTEGYFMEDKANGKSALNVPNILDLLVQSQEIVREKSQNYTKPDWFYDGELELPSGNKQRIYIAQNETGKFTIMKPEDY